MTLDQRIAVLTGPKRIGHPFALDLVSQGADIALIDRRSRDEAVATAAAVGAPGRRAWRVQADRSRTEARERAIDEAARGARVGSRRHPCERRGTRAPRGGAGFVRDTASGCGRRHARWPMRRGGDYRQAVRFLIASDVVTGETIRVDGGRHVR